jgi:hypothetical protein
LPLRETYYQPAGSPPLSIYADPSVRSTYETAWERATCWRNIEDDQIVDALADIAAHASLVSGMAARDALVYYMGFYYGHQATPETEPMLLRRARQYLNWPSDWAVFDDTAEDFIWPTYYDGELPGHSENCDCGTCRPCGCMRAHCANCYPDGPPPGLCDCRRCRPPEMDDMGDDDDWEGPPAMPDLVPGRCRFGVEVEFNNGDRHNISVALQRAGIACIDTGYTHEVARYWKMTTDSSVTGGECVSPILSGDDASIEQARHVLRLVKEHGGCTGKNVGLHVHVDVTPFGTRELKALAHNLRRSQMFFAGFCPDHRYKRPGDDDSGDGWAKLLTDDDWDAIQEWVADISPIEVHRSRENRERSCPVERFVAFNFNSLLTYGTIEVRLLGHTLNTIKFRTWVRTLQAVMEASRQGKRMPRGDILAWLEQFGLEQEHADHFREIVTRRGNEQFLLAA